MTDKKYAILFCAPHDGYPEPPPDYSAAELIDCPECHKKMWLTVKKKAVIKLCDQAKRPVLLLCFHCFMKKAEEGFFNHETISVGRI